MESLAKSEHVIFSFNSITAEAESDDFTIGELQVSETPLLKGGWWCFWRWCLKFSYGFFIHTYTQKLIKDSVSEITSKDFLVFSHIFNIKIISHETIVPKRSSMLIFKLSSCLFIIINMGIYTSEISSNEPCYLSHER